MSAKAVAATVGLLVMVALLPGMTRSADREGGLVVRGMAFYLENDARTPNPAITLKAGETVRVVVRNQDRGMTHDFAAPAFDAGIDLIDWNETDQVTFDVPSTPGSYEYYCNPHRLMMRGTITVIP